MGGWEGEIILTNSYTVICMCFNNSVLILEDTMHYRHVQLYAVYTSKEYLEANHLLLLTLIFVI